MKLTYGHLLASLDAFGRFMASSLPLKTSIAMKDVARRVQQLVADYHEERLKLCEQFGTLNKETNNYEFENDDAKAKFDASMTELHGVAVDVPGGRIRLAGLLSSMAISPGDLIALEWLIDDGVTAYEAPAETAFADTIDDDDPLELTEKTEAAAA